MKNETSSAIEKLEEIKNLVASVDLAVTGAMHRDIIDPGSLGTGLIWLIFQLSAKVAEFELSLKN